MKIKKQTMVNFLKKISMTDTSTIDETIFNFTEEGLKITGRTKDNSTRVDALLKINSFENYNALGKIAVQEIPKIIMIMNNFNDSIEILVEGNLLTLKETGKKVGIELLDIKFLEDIEPMKELEFNNMIKLDSKVVNDFINDVRINNEFVINITTRDKITLLSNPEGKFKFNSQIETPDSKADVSVSFGDPFKFAVTNLTDELSLELSNEFPIRITEVTDDSTIVIITAPRIENTE